MKQRTLVSRSVRLFVCSWGLLLLALLAPAPTTHAQELIFADGFESGDLSAWLGATGGPIAISGVTPAEGTIGTTITITGSGFADPGLQMFLSGATAVALDLLEVQDNQVVAQLLSGTPPGDYSVMAVRATKSAISQGIFDVRLPTNLVFQPASVGPGLQVTMSGTFLGSQPGQIAVRSQADQAATQYGAQIISWSDGGAVFIMPSGLPADGPGDVIITNLVGSVTAAAGVTLDGGPRVVSAVATSNTEVLVQFSEPLLGGAESAENPAHYRITGPQGVFSAETPAHDRVTGPEFARTPTVNLGAENAAHDRIPGPETALTPSVGVLSAELVPPTNSTVRLTTISQSDLVYTLVATSIFDVAGNPIAPPTILVDPSTTTFVGMPPTGEQIDTDGDGLTDSDEQRGWIVRVYLDDVEVDAYHVTSDPGDPTLGDDCSDDATCSLVNLMARDTDQDGVTDNEEKHGGIDPRSPDTDGDILTDNHEWNIIYSDPKNQDSDGDGTQDGFEFYSYRSSPLLADTDGDQINDTEEVTGRNRDPRIADIPRTNISVGEVRLQIDERFTYEDTNGSTVTTESSSSSSLTETETTTATRGEETVLEALLKFEKEIPSATITTGLELKGSYTFSSSRESAIESQQVHERSLTKGEEFSTTSAVTREIVGASINVDVTLHNEGDISFAISNIEITVLQRDRQSSDRLIPVATLIPNTTHITGESAVFNLGPFTPERGPILFSSLDVFPNLVEQLMQAPSGLVFEVANFDMTDEFGRVFTFANQIARDRTAGIVIDYGDGVVERHLVATALQPDPDGYGNRGPDDEFVGGFNSDGSPKGIPLDFALQDILQIRKRSANECAWNPPDSESTTGCDGIVAGLDSTADSSAAGDDIQLIPAGTTGVSVGSIVISAGQNGELESDPSGDDQAEGISGYETSLSCDAESPKAGEICAIDTDCDRPDLDPPLLGGSCTGPEVLVRFGSLRTGDFQRQWVVLTTGNIPAGASFGQVVLEPGMDIFLAFVQDLDDDGLFAREEFLVGSTDSAADVYRNYLFGRYWKNLPFLVGSGDEGLIADSKDTDRDGLGDFAEVRVGWKVDSGAGLLRQVYPSPRLRDSDGDGLLDPVEKDLRDYCFNNSPKALPAVCAFDSEPPVAKADAIAIIAGPNGIVDSSAAAGDFQEIPQGENCEPCVWPEEVTLQYGRVVISEGTQEGIQTDLAGDDRYLSASLTPPPASDPALSDTDADGIADSTELESYIVAFGLRDGGNGFAETQANGDDIQKVFPGHPVSPNGIVILPGPNGQIDTAPGGDDKTPCIYLGANQVFETVTVGDDVLDVNGLFICGGANRILDSIPAGDDYPFPGGAPVRTDPLRRDSDSDLVADGRELELGGNPQDPSDGGDFVDSDLDGLTDAEETELGWLVYVNLDPIRLVHSNPSRPDSDFDGLPDFVERDIGTDPNSVDTDGDNLSDFDEFARFEDYFGLAEQFPGFSLDGSTSEQYGTTPTSIDSDSDSLWDSDELILGYQLLLASGEVRQIYPDPLRHDTDLDGRQDNLEWYFTDATDPDTDDDGKTDGEEFTAGTDPLVPDLAVRVEVLQLRGVNNVNGDGGNGVNEMTFWFTTKGPNDTNPEYLFGPFGAVPATLGVDLFVFSDTENCWWYRMLANAHYTLHPNPNYDIGRTIILKEGESFTLNGIIGEIDDVAPNCGQPPYFIPSYLRDNHGCVGNYNETFVYNDFVDGGAVGTAENNLNTEKCSFTFEYSLIVQ